MSHSDDSEMSFQEILALVEASLDGRRKTVIETMHEAVEKAVSRAAEYQSKASVTLKIHFEPEKKAGDRMLVSAEVSAKLPEPGTLPFPAYVDRYKKLHTEDPGQTRMFDDRGAVRHIDEAK